MEGTAIQRDGRSEFDALPRGLGACLRLRTFAWHEVRVVYEQESVDLRRLQRLLHDGNIGTQVHLRELGARLL